MVVEVNWLMLHQECRRAVFSARYCSSCTQSELFSILENKLIGDADDSTLMTVVPSPGVTVAVAESLVGDPGRVSEWCE